MRLISVTADVRLRATSYMFLGWGSESLALTSGNQSGKHCRFVIMYDAMMMMLASVQGGLLDCGLYWGKHNARQLVTLVSCVGQNQATYVEHSPCAYFHGDKEQTMLRYSRRAWEQSFSCSSCMRRQWLTLSCHFLHLSLTYVVCIRPLVLSC